MLRFEIGRVLLTATHHTTPHHTTKERLNVGKITLIPYITCNIKQIVMNASDGECNAKEMKEKIHS